MSSLRLSVVSVCGVDAAQFLQGQITADIAHVSKQSAVFSAVCDTRGRVQATFVLAQIEEEQYWCILPTQMVGHLMTHFTRYAVFSKVTIEHCSDVHVYPLSIQDAPHIHNPKLLIHMHHDILCVVEQRLTDVTESSMCFYEQWMWNTTEAACVWIVPETRGLFLPSVLLLDQCGGLSVHKGCYLGQEVIARAHYLGLVKRHVYHIHFNHRPLLGDIICNVDASPVGYWVQSAANQKGCVALAVLEGRACAGTELIWNDVRLSMSDFQRASLPHSLITSTTCTC